MLPLRVGALLIVGATEREGKLCGEREGRLDGMDDGNEVGAEVGTGVGAEVGACVIEQTLQVRGHLSFAPVQLLHLSHVFFLATLHNVK